MVDWKKIYETWNLLSMENKQKILAGMDKKAREKTEEFKKWLLEDEYRWKVYDKLATTERFILQSPFEAARIERARAPKPEVTEVPPKPTPVPTLAPTPAVVGPRFKPGDKAVYRWTGEEYTIADITHWPSILVEDSSGNKSAKDEKQLVTRQEYEALKAEQAERLGKKIPREKAPSISMPSERDRDKVLRDIFYAGLTREGVPIRDGYRAAWRLKLPELLKLPSKEEQEREAEDFVQEIKQQYTAEREMRRKRFFPREERRPLALPAGWKPVEGGYLVNGAFVPEAEAPSLLPAAPTRPEEEVRPLLTGFARRRCPHEDHESGAWVKEHPEVEEEFPGGEFLANTEEERASYLVACPGVYRNRRFLKFCPYHRRVLFNVWLTTFGKWVEVYAWMYKVSGGRQGFNPDYIINEIKQGNTSLNWEDYDRPVTWHPPQAVFDYWKSIGWAIPEKIEEVWEKEFEEAEGRPPKNEIELQEWVAGPGWKMRKGI